ncbi:MAG: hypothetical protein IKJ67_01530 [Bacteroidales bacterium]|nr:hypothetical protein [Bacteroidales bacterium]
MGGIVMDVKKVKKIMKVGPKKDKELYGLRWINYGNVDNDILLEEIDDATTFSDSDCEAILKEFANVVMRRVANGHVVDLGVLGTLRPKITAKAVDTEEECVASTIQNVGILYQPAVELTTDAKKISVNVINIGPTAEDDSPTEPDTEPDDSGNGGDNTGDGGSGDGGFAG